jgi:Xaa-Pro dipeptidase
MNEPHELDPARQSLKRERLQRAYRLMLDLGLDILLAASTDSIQNRGHVRYLTNYSTSFGLSMAVLPAQGEPVLLVPAGSFQLDWAQDMAWVADIRAVHNLSAAAAAVLAELGQGASSVGLVGFESLPGSIESEITSASPGMHFRQVTRRFLLTRAVKTPDEIALARQSVSLADSVFGDLSSGIHPGIAETEIFARAAWTLRSAGAEDYFLLGSSGTKPPMPIPAPKPVEAGETVRFSVEPAGPGGFWTQTIRVFSLRKPTPEVRDAFALCADALQQASESLRPGITGGTIAQTVIEILEEADGGHIGPLGHGMGLDLTEPPFILPEDETRIEPGMVVAIHPYLRWRDAIVWMGDTFLITDDGSENLSTTHNDLLIV